MDKNTICIVTNRSSINVGYTIPESNIRRHFAPGEVKQIPYDELAKLTYQPGGRNIIDKYFYIEKKEITDSLGVHREIEYDWDEARIKQLLLEDSLDQFLDCLDFAPQGVIEIIKKLAVELPLSDYEKKKALKKKTGIDVDAIYRNTVIANDEDGVEVEEKHERRVKPVTETKTPNRRYNVVG